MTGRRVDVLNVKGSLLGVDRFISFLKTGESTSMKVITVISGSVKTRRR